MMCLSMIDMGIQSHIMIGSYEKSSFASTELVLQGEPKDNNPE